MVFALLCECLLLLAWICGRVVALVPDDDDVMTTSNGAWVSFAIIVGLSGGLLLLLFMLLKVRSFHVSLSIWFTGQNLFTKKCMWKLWYAHNS